VLLKSVNKEDKMHISIEVVDNGIGISELEQAKLF
jgi:signal transduction histidine kinase